MSGSNPCSVCGLPCAGIELIACIDALRARLAAYESREVKYVEWRVKLDELDGEETYFPCDDKDDAKRWVKRIHPELNPRAVLVTVYQRKVGK